MARRNFGGVRKLSSRRWQASYCKVTFGDYSLTWLQRQGHLRPRTRELYEFLLRKHIDPTFGPRSLTAIANSEVVAWYRGLGARVPGTAPKCFRLLRQIMAAAVADSYLVKSPVVIKGASREHVEEKAIPTLPEVVLWPRLSTPVSRHDLVAGACGLRFGELAALRRGRVDLPHKEVRVAETITELVGGERFVGPPKTESGRRTVAIPSSIVPIVSEHLEMIAAEPDTLLFPAPEGVTSSGTISANECGCQLLPILGLATDFMTCVTPR